MSTLQEGKNPRLVEVAAKSYFLSHFLVCYVAVVRQHLQKSLRQLCKKKKKPVCINQQREKGRDKKFLDTVMPKLAP